MKVFWLRGDIRWVKRIYILYIYIFFAKIFLMCFLAFEIVTIWDGSGEWSRFLSLIILHGYRIVREFRWNILRRLGEHPHKRVRERSIPKVVDLENVELAEFWVSLDPWVLRLLSATILICFSVWSYAELALMLTLTLTRTKDLNGKSDANHDKANFAQCERLRRSRSHRD